MKKILILSVFIFLCLPLVGCGGHTHSLTEWHTETPASCEDAEILKRECISCEYYETKQGRDSLGHNHQKTIINPSETQTGYTRYRCVCGDEYYDEFKCFISFESTTQNSDIQTSDLPAINNATVNRGYKFNGVAQTEQYKPVSYQISVLGGTNTILNLEDVINDSCKITIVWDYITPPVLSEEEIAFNELIAKIQKLEEISALYNQTKGVSSDANLRVMQYIRNIRYNDSEWNGFGGTMETDFSSFVDANEGALDLSTLQTMSNFVIPSTGKSVDFVHMVAILNVIANPSTTATNIYDLVGFCGDLCQLAVEVKTSSTGKTASDLFMAADSSFSSYDLYADIDAVNLGAVYNNLSAKSLSGAMSSYYKNLAEAKQKSQFITNTLSGLDTSSVASLAEDLVSRLSSNLYIKYWASQNGLSFTNDANIILACATCFADYLI